MLGDDIADYLSSAGCGTVGTDVFVGQFPDDIDQGLAVYETGGLPSEHAFHASPTGIGTPVALLERPRVQVIARSATYQTARAKIADAFNVLDGLRNRTINGVQYHWVRSVQSPYDLGIDANQLQRFSVNFDVMKAVSTSTSA